MTENIGGGENAALDISQAPARERTVPCAAGRLLLQPSGSACRIHLMTQAINIPAPDLPPGAPLAAPHVTVMIPGANGVAIPVTTADIAALRARKTELSNQLESAVSRRNEVQHALRGAVGVDKAGLEQRLGVLDARIVRLESDIDQNSGALASLDVTRHTALSPVHWGPDTGNNIANNAMPLAIIFVIFVLSPIAISISRLLWKRGSRSPAISSSNTDNFARLERMEQSMDAIAVEIERVSEGQRFVTRLLAGSPATPIGAARPAAEPVIAGARESFRAPR